MKHRTQTSRSLELAHFASRDVMQHFVPPLSCRRFCVTIVTMRQFIACHVALITLLGTFAIAGPPLDMKVFVGRSKTRGRARYTHKVEFPGDNAFEVASPSKSWTDVDTLLFSVFVPDDAPTNIQAMVHIKDWDYFWYQSLLPGHVVPGRTNQFELSFAVSAENWTACNHHGSWHHRALMQPKEVMIHVLCDQAYTGECTVAGVRSLPRPPHKTAPYIRNVLANTNRLACYEKFELTFEAPDRYPNPFDPEQVSVTASFENANGKITRIDGYYGRDFYRQLDSTSERIIPQGPPYWRIRFAPTEEGRYKYRLNIRDENGSAQWGPAWFEATAAKTPGFIRASKKDPRYFEFDNGEFFYPIGHNTRSPFDSRMNQQFPWAQRWPEGSAVYARYFDAMSRHGENMCEVWTAAWSLGLEWTARQRGYHGLGQYNMMNAWELDRVLEHATARGIYINLVIHNHGKFSAYSDEEWAHNPFNKRCGGSLDSPDEFFSDPRAHDAFRNLMRYMIARWGYSSHIFAWETWSELNLTGSRAWRYKPHYKEPVINWLRTMGSAIKDMDPNDHMVSAHISGDYKQQNVAILKLDQMDLCPVDAYHDSADPLHIVTLLQKTAAFNNRYGKPTLVTEFGGAWHAQGVRHLEESLHAAIWAATAIPIGGTPMFWWWQLIDEENLYPEFIAVNKFMAGEDKRDPSLKQCIPNLSFQGDSASIGAQCMKNDTRALGWIYNSDAYGNDAPVAPQPIANLILGIDEMKPGKCTVEFWDTRDGGCISREDITATQGTIAVSVPPFAHDIAFKIKSVPAN
jgi:hypothetical protein